MAVAEQSLEKELATYESNREALVGSALDKHVLIHGDEIVGTYDTERDAVNEGYRRLGNVPFLVRHVAPVDRPVNFLNGLVSL
jgi:hypothetical protein